MSTVKTVLISAIVATVISLVSVFTFVSVIYGSGALLGVSVTNSSGPVHNGRDVFTSGIQIGQIQETGVEQKLPVGSRQVILFRNTTGRDVLANGGDITIPTGETASSTKQDSIIATSTATIPLTEDFVTLSANKNFLLGPVTNATSSTASTTSSAGVGRGAVVVPDGWYLIGYEQANTCLLPGAQCESATSTNKGANPFFRVRLSFF